MEDSTNHSLNHDWEICDLLEGLGAKDAAAAATGELRTLLAGVAAFLQVHQCWSFRDSQHE